MARICEPISFFYLFALIFCFVPRGRLGWTPELFFTYDVHFVQ